MALDAATVPPGIELRGGRFGLEATEHRKHVMLEEASYVAKPCVPQPDELVLERVGPIEQHTVLCGGEIRLRDPAFLYLCKPCRRVDPLKARGGTADLVCVEKDAARPKRSMNPNEEVLLHSGI